MCVCVWALVASWHLEHAPLQCVPAAMSDICGLRVKLTCEMAGFLDLLATLPRRGEMVVTGGMPCSHEPLRCCWCSCCARKLVRQFQLQCSSSLAFDRSNLLKEKSKPMREMFAPTRAHIALLDLCVWDNHVLCVFRVWLARRSALFQEYSSFFVSADSALCRRRKPSAWPAINAAALVHRLVLVVAWSLSVHASR